MITGITISDELTMGITVDREALVFTILLANGGTTSVFFPSAFADDVCEALRILTEQPNDGDE